MDELMNEHVEKWLAAYYDGELAGANLEKVEAHLAVCEPCRAELETLVALSALLQESPAPESLTSSKQFAAQVGLRLPRRQERPAWQRGLTVLWYAVPAFILLAWVFTSAVLTQTRWLGLAFDLGLWPAPAGLEAGLGPFSPLALQLTLSAVAGLGLLGWAVSWWVRTAGRINGTE